jgi:hypothetical protein
MARSRSRPSGRQSRRLPGPAPRQLLFPLLLPRDRPADRAAVLGRKAPKPGATRHGKLWRLWLHTEVVVRLEALWKAWKSYGFDPGAGASTWLRDRADPTTGTLTSPLGRSPAQTRTPRHLPPLVLVPTARTVLVDSMTVPALRVDRCDLNSGDGGRHLIRNFAETAAPRSLAGNEHEVARHLYLHG